MGIDMTESSSKISELAKKSSIALKTKNWEELETVSRQLFQILGKEETVHEADLRKVARNYLASTFRDGKFLLGEDKTGLLHFRDEISGFRRFIESSPPILLDSVRAEIRYVQQVQLFLADGKGDASNKAASSLRRLGRPDLAIALSTMALNKSRLNYYVLVVRASAHVDLNEPDLAIPDLEIALKHSPRDKQTYPLTVLARAYREIFRRNGDFKDGEKALEYAEKSLSLDRNPFIARIFISIVRALGNLDHEELISELETSIIFDFENRDDLAIGISKSILDSALLEQTDADVEPDEDFIDDLDGDWIDGQETDYDSPSDYFEDYFEDYVESLNDPQRPDLEP